MRRAGFVPAPIDVADGAVEPSARAFQASSDARTEAIVATHAFGRPAPMRALRAIADRHGLALVEDAAQALGARPSGRPLGALSDAAVVSFGPTKPLAGWGGGAVLTRSSALARRLRARRGGPGSIPSRSLRLARGALFELLSRGAPIAWAPDRLVEGWLTDPSGALRPRPWHELAMGAPEACLVRRRLGDLRALTARSRAMHAELTRRIGRSVEHEARAWADAPNGIGFGVLVEVPSARATSRLLRRAGIDAPHAELVDVGADGPHTARLARRLLRIPVIPDASPDRVARRVRAALRPGADVG
jgi:hypothetical protein